MFNGLLFDVVAQENAVDGGQIPGKLFSKIKYIDTVEERRQKVHLAKMDTRSRRSHETQVSNSFSGITCELSCLS